MGWLRIYPAKDANGDPIPMTGELARFAAWTNAEADRLDHNRDPLHGDAEEYAGEAKDRGLVNINYKGS